MKTEASKEARWQQHQRCKSNTDQRCYSFIILTTVGRFSKFFHIWILQETCNKILVMFFTTPERESWNFRSEQCKIRYVIVSLSRNICWNNTVLGHRSSELCRQLQRFNGCQTRKHALQIRRRYVPHHPVYKCWHQIRWTGKRREEQLTLNAASRRKLFSLTRGGSVASNVRRRYLISIV